MVDKLIKNGTIVSHTGKYRGNLAVKDGRIWAITDTEEEMQAVEVIDASGKYIIPGLIDSHVHFQDPGFTEREDFESATAAAAAGGVTTAISHPMNNPPIVDEASYQFTVEAYNGRGIIDYGIHGGGTSSNIDKVEGLWKNTGAVSIKMFMCFSVAEFPYVRDDALYAILKKLSEINGLAMLHAENNELIEWNEKRLKAEGRLDPMAYHESHCAEGELESVKRALYYLELTGAKGVILHSGMCSALEEIRAAQRRGVKVYAECCPHFLTFTDKDMAEYGPYLKFSPVMRDEENRKKLWEMLEQGYIQTIGSDHSPYTEEEKRRGMTDIWASPNGIPGIQTTLPVLLDGVNQGRLSMERLVEVTSWNPSRIYGLDYRKGSLTVGKDADFVIVDMEKVHTYSKADIKSKAKWSPYTGKTFKGWPVMTFVRGCLTAKDGEITGVPGWGRYIERRK
ncbi:dihydroorotase [Lachnospiraceae bacterium 62-35]